MVDDWLSFISIPTVQLHTAATMVQSSKRSIFIRNFLNKGVIYNFVTNLSPLSYSVGDHWTATAYSCIQPCSKALVHLLSSVTALCIDPWNIHMN